MTHQGKRIVVCLDGTWDNGDDGYMRPTFSEPKATLQVPSNVTRLYRALSKGGLDGMYQIIYYHFGVGSVGNITNALAGGLFGSGISENIREAYDFISANYEPADEIVLVGFSRGAFTARSVAGLICEIGLLTRDGMHAFYPIFKDAENFRNPHYKDQFPNIPFPNKPKSPHNGKDYKRRLEEGGFTRVYDPDGRPIKVRCVAVWDTVGSLGIPDANFLMKLGALALDENRTSFAPAVWERPPSVRTDLRQVWFPGSHANVGGGYPDQELANVSMAWMMDQLASIGVGFKGDTIEKIFRENVRYYFNPPPQPKSIFSVFKRKPWTQWAIESVYQENRPVRPWGLGEVYESDTGLYVFAGKTTRTPGLYHRVDPQNALPTRQFLINTNERIHSSVRIRLELEGLGYDDVGLYKCPALLKEGSWRLRRTRLRSGDTNPRGVKPNGSYERNGSLEQKDNLRWVWEYAGPAQDAPPEKIMVEEELGQYERELLSLNKGRTFYRSLLRKRNRKRRRKNGADEIFVEYDDR